MDETIYVTVTGFAKYYQKKPFDIGNVLVCTKEPTDRNNPEAIIARLPIVGQVGYIANGSVNVAGGTMSAGRIYDKVEDKFYIRVLFTTQSKIICRIESGSEEELNKEIQNQLMKSGDWMQRY